MIGSAVSTACGAGFLRGRPRPRFGAVTVVADATGGKIYACVLFG